MAEFFVDIFGTEKDKLNCPFYWKIGSCRHGEKCVRAHNKPTFSQTILLPHMYDNPIATKEYDEYGRQRKYDKKYLDKHFEEFYEDLFLELSTIGKIDEINVCNNIAAHLVGNVYIKFFKLEDAQKCLTILTGRYYAGKLLKPEYSPVTDFREARCRQYETNNCERGGTCNFMHLKKVSPEFDKKLWSLVDMVPPSQRVNNERRRRGGRERYFSRRDDDGYREREYDRREREYSRRERDYDRRERERDRYRRDYDRRDRDDRKRRRERDYRDDYKRRKY